MREIAISATFGFVPAVRLLYEVSDFARLSRCWMRRFIELDFHPPIALSTDILRILGKFLLNIGSIIGKLSLMRISIFVEYNINKYI